MPANGRPRVLVNCATSLDGKLQRAPALRSGDFVMSRGHEDHRRMRALRSRADAVIIGAENLRVDDPDLALLDDERMRRRATGMTEPLRVVVTRSGGRIEPSRRFFDKGLGGESIVAHTANLPEESRRALEPVATLVEPGSGAPPREERSSAPRAAAIVDVTRLLSWLWSERGCHTVLVEGGGAINAAFFAARAVDELFQTVVPRVLGGSSAPTLVDGDGFGEARYPTRLLELERIGDELYLHYGFVWP